MSSSGLNSYASTDPFKNLAWGICIFLLLAMAALVAILSPAKADKAPGSGTPLEWPSARVSSLALSLVSCKAMQPTLEGDYKCTEGTYAGTVFTKKSMGELREKANELAAKLDTSSCHWAHGSINTEVLCLSSQPKAAQFTGKSLSEIAKDYLPSELQSCTAVFDELPRDPAGDWQYLVPRQVKHFQCSHGVSSPITVAMMLTLELGGRIPPEGFRDIFFKEVSRAEKNFANRTAAKQAVY